MSFEKLKTLIGKGPRIRCAITGKYFHQSEMVKDSMGRWVHKNVVRRDHDISKYRKGPGWERRTV